MAFRFVRGYSAWHSGIDLSAPTGTPVHAVNGGQVRFAGSATSPATPSIARGGGNVVVVRVGSRDEIYAHLNAVRTFTGATIARGGLVGTVGSTGNSTGPHLHYAWWVNGRSIAPSIGTTELIAAVSGSAPGGGGAVLVETPGTQTGGGIAVPYGDFFRRVRNPPVSPTFVVSAALNEGWAQWVVESYPPLRSYLPIPAPGEPNTELFNADVKRLALAAATVWIGKPVSATPATLPINLPAQGDWVSSLLGGVYEIGKKGAQVAILAVLVFLGIKALTQ